MAGAAPEDTKARHTHILKVGDVCGIQKVLKLTLAASKPAYSCKCLRCGRVKNYRENRLLAERTKNATRCRECMDRAMTAEASKYIYDTGCGPHCRVCYGLPHRRPMEGACACGETYAAEVIEIESHNQSPIARCAEAI